MADIATLARHLLMAEVLQICESVHKQVEEQQLMVYQRGDTHTVVSSQPAGPEAVEEEEEEGSFLVTIQSDGQAVVTHAVVAAAADPSDPEADEEGVLVEQALAIVSQAEVGNGSLVSHGDQVGLDDETVTLIGRVAGEEEGETLTVVTHSGQAGASDSLAVVSACLAMEQPQTDEPAAQDPPAAAVSEETPAEQGATSQATGALPQEPIPDTPTTTAAATTATTATTTESSQEGAVSTTTVGEETTTSLEVVPVEAEAIAELEPPPPKRKRGRPAKVKKEVVVMEEEVFSFYYLFLFHLLILSDFNVPSNIPACQRIGSHGDVYPICVLFFYFILCFIFSSPIF